MSAQTDESATPPQSESSISRPPESATTPIPSIHVGAASGHWSQSPPKSTRPHSIQFPLIVSAIGLSLALITFWGGSPSQLRTKRKIDYLDIKTDSINIKLGVIERQQSEHTDTILGAIKQLVKSNMISSSIGKPATTTQTLSLTKNEDQTGGQFPKNTQTEKLSAKSSPAEFSKKYFAKFTVGVYCLKGDRNSREMATRIMEELEPSGFKIRLFEKPLEYYVPMPTSGPFVLSPIQGVEVRYDADEEFAAADGIARILSLVLPDEYRPIYLARVKNNPPFKPTSMFISVFFPVVDYEKKIPLSKPTTDGSYNLGE